MAAGALIFNPADLPDRLARGEVFPAIILSGAEGTGKASLAIWWEKSLNCSQAQSGQPCGQCRTCRLIGERRFADLILLAPAEEGGNLKIDQVRDMQQRVLYPNVEGRYRMVLIERAETLQEAAANCLLKILEEPPANTVFVLCTTNHFRLPPTVVSRCRLFKLLPVDRPVLSRWLQTEHGQEPRVAELFSRLAEGAPGRAIALASDKGGMALRQSVLDAFERMTGQTSAVDAAEALGKVGVETRDRMMRLLQTGATWYRDLLLLAIGVNPSEVINVDRLDALRSMARPESRERWQQGVKILTLARRHVEANVGNKLLLQWLASQLTESPEDMRRTSQK